MKKIVLSLILFGFFFAGTIYAQSNLDKSNDSTEIIFNELDHNFGNINYKSEGTFEFVFKNTGKDPLVLSNVRSSCGCTVPEWPREPILKGDKGKIRVSYNTRITGSFSKSITVYSNAGDPILLNIKGKVEAAK